MRLHYRLPALALAAALALSVASCQTLGGSKGSPADFARLKDSLIQNREGMRQAIADQALDRVGALMDGLSTDFDEIWSKSSAMNLLDRENMAIQLATGRRMITSIRQWVTSTDIDAVKSETERLNGVLDEIDILLDHTIRATAVDSTGGP